MKVRERQKGDDETLDTLMHKLHPDLPPDQLVPFDLFKAETKVFVSEEEGKIIGFVWVTFVEYGLSRIGYIEELFVGEGYRNKNTGRSLVNKVRDYFKGKRAEVIFISVSIEDKESLTFYKKLGAKKCKGYWLFMGVE